MFRSVAALVLGLSLAIHWPQWTPQADTKSSKLLESSTTQSDSYGPEDFEELEEIEPTPIALAPFSLPAETVPPVAAPSLLTLYPENSRLVSPFGRGVALASQGLMEWLAPRAKGRWHSGLDLVPVRGRTRGRKLYAPGNGFLLKKKDWHPGWGSFLFAVFRKGDELFLMSFFHLQARSHSHLQERDMARGISGQLTQGQFLGRVGKTGAARGAHLHMDVIRVNEIVGPDEISRQVWRNRDWSQFVHPATVLDGLPWATFKDRDRPQSGSVARAHHPACSPHAS